jgi:hypothetical protein
MKTLERKTTKITRWMVFGCVAIGGAIWAVVIGYPAVKTGHPRKAAGQSTAPREALSYKEKRPVDTAGFTAVLPLLERWPPTASIE